MQNLQNVSNSIASITRFFDRNFDVFISKTKSTESQLSIDVYMSYAIIFGNMLNLSFLMYIYILIGSYTKAIIGIETTAPLPQKYFLKKIFGQNINIQSIISQKN